jgi:type I restriction enzyme S subunit
LEEQIAIVRFIEHADGLIRRYIRAKKKLLKLLAEERAVITANAIKSPNTQTLPLETVAEKVERPIDRRSDHTYTPIGLYNRGRGIFHKEPTKGADLGDSTFFWIEEGDLVLSGQFAWEGAVALAGLHDHGCVATHRYPVMRGKPGVVESPYLLSFFRTEMGHLLLNHHSRGAAGRNRPLNTGTLMKEKIPVPPLPEQQRVAAIIHLETLLYHAVSKIEKLLHQCRTRLISDVVTGKLDVREAAARLPDTPLEPETVEEPEEIEEIDEEPDASDLEETAA